MFGAFLLAFMMLPASPAGAQGTDDILDDDFLDEFTEYRGFENGVVRMFTADFSAGLPGAAPHATPDASDDVTPEASPGGESGAIVAVVGVLQFDTEDNAIAAVQDVNNELADEDDGEAFEADGLEGETAAFSFMEEEDGMTFSGATVVTQDGDQMVFVVAAGEGGDLTDAAVTQVEEIIDAEEGSGTADFHRDGNSTGGLWDKLPTTESLILPGLPMAHDVELTPGQDND
jgi:hypothetical protein